MSRLLLADVTEGNSGLICAIKDDSADFLKYLNKKGIYLGAKVTIIEKNHFDDSMDIAIDNQHKMNISRKIADHILIII